jgi:hypothetical protein
MKVMIAKRALSWYRLQTFDEPGIIRLWKSHLSKFHGGISIKVYCMASWADVAAGVREHTGA